jgi:butyryl-CoA dehydrogenase
MSESNAPSETDERALLRDAAARYVERDYTFEQRRSIAETAAGHSAERWAAFAEMGWLALGAPEDCGGFGDLQDAAIVAEALGRAQALEPWLAQVGLSSLCSRACMPTAIWPQVNCCAA